MPREAKAPALIVRHDPARFDEALREARHVLERVGEPDALVRPTAIPGNLTVLPEGDPHEAQGAITQMARDEPELFRFTSRWTVVDAWVPTEIGAIRKAVAAYQRDIGATDSWRVAVRPSRTGLHRQAVIDAIAPLIQNAPVDLENPVKEIRVDILGDETGIGLLGRDEVFPHGGRA